MALGEATPGDFGSGLGTVIGANMANNDLENAQSSVNGVASNADQTIAGVNANFQQATNPYNTFGQSFLPTASTAIGGVQTAANSTQGYNDFMKTYTNTPAAQYQLQQADQVQNNSAAAKGNILSGSNERALGTISNGIVSQNASTAYNEYLAGNNQQFGQLESALGNMFSAIGVGQTATGQQGSLDAAQIGADASIAGSQIGATSQLGQAQSKNDQSKGSGFGSMFSGLGTAALAF